MAKGINNKISAGYAYYLTLTIEEWIDVFSRPVYKHIIVDSLNYCIANKGFEVYCWCLMSNHLWKRCTRNTHHRFFRRKNELHT